MIKASELRIGNYFHPMSKNVEVQIPASAVIHQVGSVDKFGNISVIEHDAKTITLTTKEISPIPLTPELLKKIGFDTSENGTLYIQVGNTTYLEYQDGHWSVTPETWRGTLIDFWGEVKYLHQLQNLYYSLSGEELKIAL